MKERLVLAIQVLGALLVCGSQFFRMLETVEGVSLARFLLTEGFLAMQFLLAWGAHLVRPTRTTKETLYIYTWWGVLFVTNFELRNAFSPLKSLPTKTPHLLWVS